MKQISSLRYWLFKNKKSILGSIFGFFYRCKGIIYLSNVGSAEKNNFNIRHIANGYEIENYKNLNSSLLKETNFVMKPFIAVTLSNGRLITDLGRYLAIFGERNYILEECSFAYVQNKEGIFYHGSSEQNYFFHLQKVEKPKIFKGIVFSLLTGGGKNFNIYHWFLDSLARLYAIKDDLQKVDFFLIPEYTQNYQIASLKYFGIEENRIISSLNCNHIIASNLICTTHPRTATFSVRSEIALYLRDMFNSLNQNKIDKRKNYPPSFYICRRDSPRRKVNNEIELILMLQKLHIDSIEISNYTFDEIVYLFKNARLVVSTHSAALTNILFCRPGTKIIECTTRLTFLPYYSELAKSLNLDYKSFINEIDEIKLYNSRYEIQNELTLNIDTSSLLELIANINCVD